MVNLITENLELWSSTYLAKKTAGRGSNGKPEAYGIKKLRELILVLAVRGKLVPQDPNDEPVSILLEKIEAEKERLVKEGKIKKQKRLLEIAGGERAFHLPVSWEWVRLQDVSTYIQRGKGPKYSDSGSVRVISQKCIQWAGFDLSQARYVDDTSLDSYQPERYLQKNDLLWNSTGTGTVGRINVLIEPYNNQLVADSHVTVIRPLKVNSMFLWSYIASPGIQQRISPSHENTLVSGTTKQVELNTSVVIPLAIPLPPIEEQHRIVTKVDELMALCDRLEAQQTDSIEAHQTLVEILLNTLTSSKDAQEFQESWERIAEHFDTLFTTGQSIETLKQTILQLAVMGKLIRQDSNDEPASVLLKKIETEKERLVKEGEIKKQKKLSTISEDEKPFEMPGRWEWTKLGNISADIHYGYTASADQEKRDVRLLRITDIQNDAVNWGTVPGCEIKDEQIAGYQLENGDLLIARTGGTIGKSYLVTNIDVTAVFASYLIRVKHLTEMSSAYIKTFLGSQLYWDQLYENSMGTGQPNVNGNALKNLLFALPPLKEQHRIVAKVDELIALCDTLQKQLEAAQTTQIHLADAIVEQAVK